MLLESSQGRSAMIMAPLVLKVLYLNSPIYFHTKRSICLQFICMSVRILLIAKTFAWNYLSWKSWFFLLMRQPPLMSDIPHLKFDKHIFPFPSPSHTLPQSLWSYERASIIIMDMETGVGGLGFLLGCHG